MRKIGLFLVGLLLVAYSYGQVAKEKSKTILYLIPFYTEKANLINIDSIANEEDLYNIKSFDLISFWEGAKMAIEEFEQKKIPLNIVVRDVTDDAVKLQQVLQETSSLYKIDLIIGPFYGKMFASAAAFAKEHHIPIVNPFSTKSEIVNDNRYVYKVLPSSKSYPIKTDSLLIKRFPNNNIIIWTDNKNNASQMEYENYFSTHGIAYKKVTATTNVNAIHNYLKPHCQNIVLAFFQGEAMVTNHLQNFSLPDYSKPMTLIIPEKWLSIPNIEMEYFNRLNVYYFSNYYVNYKEDKTEYFNLNFIDEYAHPANVKNYAMQGYDITRYFIQQLFNKKDEKFPDNRLYSLSFDFKKKENGGFENQGSRLIMIENYEKVEIK